MGGGYQVVGVHAVVWLLCLFHLPVKRTGQGMYLVFLCANMHICSCIARVSSWHGDCRLLKVRPPSSCCIHSRNSRSSRHLLATASPSSSTRLAGVVLAKSITHRMPTCKCTKAPHCRGLHVCSNSTLPKTSMSQATSVLACIYGRTMPETSAVQVW